MINLRSVQRATIVGGGTAGWIASFFMKECFPQADITVVESSSIGILGAGEGTFVDFYDFLVRFGIDEKRFMEKTSATYKLGVCFDGWLDGTPRDRYYHWFADKKLSAASKFALPNDDLDLYLSYLVAKGVRVDSVTDYMALVENNASQETVRNYLRDSRDYVKFAYHFDAHRVASFLREEAKTRGIHRIDARVTDVTCSGDRVESLTLDDGSKVTSDFFVDASGFRHLMIGRLGTKWVDLSGELPVNKALAFLLPIKSNNPPLVTRSIAMKSGWMWMIPTGERLGCGYVYADQYISDEGATKEIEDVVGQDVQIINNIQFKSGYHQQVWKGNCLAVGLAASFLEPLEATSIVHTLTQLVHFSTVLVRGAKVITQGQIEAYNLRYTRTIESIKDFLLMHYVSKREDTPFWKDMKNLTKNNNMGELLELLKCRLPREFEAYFGFEKYHVSFPALSYLSVAQPLGLVDASIAEQELNCLDSESLKVIAAFHKEFSAKNTSFGS